MVRDEPSPRPVVVRELISIDPLCEFSLANRAKCYLVGNQADEAVAYCDWALELDPKDLA